MIFTAMSGVLDTRLRTAGILSGTVEAFRSLNLVATDLRRPRHDPSPRDSAPRVAHNHLKYQEPLSLRLQA